MKTTLFDAMKRMQCADCSATSLLARD